MTRWLALLLLLAACAAPAPPVHVASAMRASSALPDWCTCASGRPLCFCPRYCLETTGSVPPLVPIWSHGGPSQCRCG